MSSGASSTSTGECTGARSFATGLRFGDRAGFRYDAGSVKRSLLPLLALCACAHRAPSPAPAPAAPPAAAAPSPAPAAPAVEGPFGREQPPTADDPFRALRGDVDALLRAQAEALWAAWTRGDTVDLEKTYAGKEQLFSADTVKKVRDAMLRAEGDERRALSLLHGFLAGEHLARATAAPAEKLARARAAATISWDGQTVQADRVPSLLAAEPDAARRAALLRAQAGAAAKWAPLATALVADLDAAARRLGHPSLLALAAEIRGDSPDALAALATDVLDATGAAYERAVRDLARAELKVGPEAVRGQDLPRLLRAAQEPRLFPGPRLLADARSTFAGLGLDFEKRPGAHMDAEARPRKVPRALALPVEVPKDVRLSVIPGAGIPDLRALLHELGVATTYASIESPRVEFRRLGVVTPRSWGLLFEELAGDPAWLFARTGENDHHLSPIVRVAAARRLHAAREAAVRVLLEVRRPRTAEEAVALLERASAHPVSADEVALALADRDPLLQSADALRAMLVAAQAEATLGAWSVAGGNPWWKDPKSGAWLSRTFAEGSRPTPAAIARALSAPGLRAAPLADLTRERLRWADEH